MTQFFELRENRAVTSRYKGDFDAAHTWFLPGVECHGCGETWGATGHDYPGVDLSSMPEQSRLVSPTPVPVPVFNRLRELLRPLSPPDAELPPGTSFGPLVGTAHGDLGPLTWQGNFLLLLRRDMLEQLQADGVRGLHGCRTNLRWRQKDAPEHLELQIEPAGRLHADCIPTDAQPPCPTCGRFAFARPDTPLLDGASLPTQVDLFRVGNFATMLVGTEHFMHAVQRLGLSGISFRELSTR